MVQLDNPRFRARLLVAVLVAFGLWPPTHFILFKVVDIDPWKLGGLAMYCTRFRVSMLLWDVSGNTPRELSRVSPRMDEMASQFRETRVVLGKFAKPSSIACQALYENPSISLIKVQVGTTKFHFNSTLMTTDWFSYTYSREGLPRICGT